MENKSSSRYTVARMRLIAGLLAGAAAFLLASTAPLQALEQRLYDLRLRFLSKRTPPVGNIIIIAIDDESLDRLAPQWGRWPWPRHVMAKAIRHCREAHTIILDVLFAEPDLEDPDGDIELAQTAREHGGVVSSIFLVELDDPDPPEDDLLPFELTPGEGLPPLLLKRESTLTPYPSLLENSAAVGLVNYLADNDGVLRAHAVAGLEGNRLFPSLALAAALRYETNSATRVKLTRNRIQWGSRTIPLDAYGRFSLLPSAEPHRTIPIADVLESAEQEARGETPLIPASELRGSYVFFGSLATGLQGDRLVTSLSAYVPGVSSMATALDNLLSGSYVRRTTRSGQMLLFLAAAMLPALRPFNRPRELLTSVLIASGLYAGALGAALLAASLMLPVTLPVLTLFGSYASLGALFWIEEHTRRRALEQLEAAKQQFTDMLVHDLHNQVAPALFTLSLLREGASVDPTANARLLDGAIGNARRLAALTGALLDIRRMQEGKMALTPEVIEVGTLFEEVAAGYVSSMDRSRLRIVAPDSEEIFFAVDRDLMTRAIANLVWNALRYSETASEVELGWAAAARGCVVLWVANVGEVIPPEEQERIVRPFVTGTGSLQTRFRGTGLGLAFCQLVAEAHRGSIRIESPWQARNGGVRIEIILPAKSFPDPD